MKPHTEMIEGPKALQNFEDTMKALFSAKKTAGEKPKTHKTTKPKQAKRTS